MTTEIFVFGLSILLVVALIVLVLTAQGGTVRDDDD